MKTMIDEWEDLFESTITDLLSDQEALYEQAGARPLFFEETDRLTRLNMYLAMRNDGQAWEAWISQQVPAIGREAAEAFAICEDVRFDKDLQDYGGILAVTTDILKRHMKEALKGMAAAEKILDAPKLQIRPPDPMIDETALLRQLMNDEGV